MLGLGDTGLSVARWVEREGGRVRVADTRAAPPGLKDFKGEFHGGAFHDSLLTDVDLRSRMGARGRTLVLERYTAERMVDGVLAVYDEILGPGPGPLDDGRAVLVASTTGDSE